MIECEKDMKDLLDAWTELIDLTNDPNATEQSIEDAYLDYDRIVMEIMVKQGHPGQPFPRRRP